jgi:hypothetical protein
MKEGGLSSICHLLRSTLCFLAYHHLYYHFNFCFLLLFFFFLTWHGPVIAHSLQAFRRGRLVERAMNKYSYIVYVVLACVLFYG